MERTVVQLYLNVNNRISGQYTGLHSALDTCVNSWDVFLRNCTADNAVDELVALTGLVRGDSDRTDLYHRTDERISYQHQQVF